MIAAKTKIANTAISLPKCPESADLPGIVVITAPVEMPAIFINPYPVALYRGEAIRHVWAGIIVSDTDQKIHPS